MTAKTISPIRALALILDRHLSKMDYNEVRDVINSNRVDLLPPYYKVLEEKSHCRPDGIDSSSTCIQVPLQNCLHHTVFRILKDVEISEALVQLSEKYTDIDFICTAKVGCDGSKGFLKAKQFNHDEEEDAEIDANEGALFATNLVVMQIVALAITI